jgi:hypothetical protein
MSEGEEILLIATKGGEMLEFSLNNSNNKPV